MASISRTRFSWVLAIAMIACVLGAATTAVGQETTGRIVGSATMKTDQSPLPGVAVEALHVPTGTRYTAVTAANGRFSILNVRVGGPYTVTATISGFRPQTQKGIEIALGEGRQVSFTLELESVTEAVVVTAESTPLISPDRMGTTAQIDEDQIKALPTVRRQIQDFARTNPYFVSDTADQSGTRLSVAGKNNRYNSIQIDGAVNNDLFGLADTGTPGGQTNTQPISLDAVQEIQLVVSPYDVKQGGFTGGGINVVTKGGTNEFHGSAYGSLRSESFVSDTVGGLEKPIAEFSEDQYGARIGGPILKDRLFFFLNGEINRREAPTGVSADGSTATVYNNPAQAAAFRQSLISKYQYDPGGLGDFNGATDSDLIFGRIDFNINENHNATLRHNFIDAGNDVISDRSTSRYRFETAIYTIADKTNSSVLQVNSVFGKSSFNVGRIGYQTIRDSRQTPVIFPSVDIGPVARQPQLAAGTERFSGANSLDQDILEITDDFTLIAGNHTITIGTSNQIFDFKNLFLSDFYGWYRFSTLADWEKGVANEYSITFANGSDPRRATAFSASQWGFYAGDQWRVNDKLTLTLGLRADIPVIGDEPSRNQLVYDTFGIDTSEVPSGNVLISPRLGFNYGISPKHQVRGGIGVFAGRTPFVWISNAFGNTGVETTTLSSTNVPFVADPFNQPKSFPVGSAAVSVDAVDPDFEFPHVWRATLGYDAELAWGLRGSIEGMYTETIQDVYYTNMNKADTGVKAFDGRPTYSNISSKFRDVPYMTNTSLGKQTNLTVQLSKRFDFGLYVNGSYTYTDAQAGFEGTSSRAISNWQFHTTRGDIYKPELMRSFWEIQDRFNVVVSQNFRTGPLAHNVGFFFSAQSGTPYSVLMAGDPNKDGYATNDLAYIPASYGDMIASGFTEADWKNFLALNGLEKYQGQIIEKNSSFTPWNRSLDFHYDFEIPITFLQVKIEADILNVINLIDSDKGDIYYVANQTTTPITYQGQDTATGKPKYSASASTLNRAPWSLNDLRSRWQLRLGARLSF
jgi:hypothetical protein